MANFDMFDEEFEDIFLTQQPMSTSCVSLEDKDDNRSIYKTVLDPQYLDISDNEDKARERCLRYRITIIIKFLNVSFICKV